MQRPSTVQLHSLDTYIDRSKADTPVTIRGRFLIRLPTGDLLIASSYEHSSIVADVPAVGAKLWKLVMDQHPYLPEKVKSAAPDYEPIFPPTTQFGPLPEELPVI